MYTLNKWADDLGPEGVSTPALLAQHMIIYVARGSVKVNGEELTEGAATYAQDVVALEASTEGASLWRWGIRADDAPLGLIQGKHVSSVLRMSRKVKMFEMVPTSKWLFRLDRILNFEGTTGLHSHPGSGIRCMLKGSLRAESQKGEDSYNTRRGDVWYEEGAYPLVSTVDPGDKATFLRGMILPPEYFNVADTATWIGGFKATFEGSDRLQDILITLR